MIKLVLFVWIFYTITDTANSVQCSKSEALKLYQKPIFEFSTRILDRVSYEEDHHFVYSPISTWLRLLDLMDGAQGSTLELIFGYARLRGRSRIVCYRRQFREVLNDIQYSAINFDSERNGLMIVDQRIKGPKRNFKSEVEVSAFNQILSVDFSDPEKAAREAKSEMDKNIYWKLENIFPDDFREAGVLITDIAFFKSTWMYPFDEKITSQEDFHSLNKSTMKVDMMHQKNELHYVVIPMVYRDGNVEMKVKLIELPCKDQSFSMLIYLPEELNDIKDLYYVLQYYNLNAILSHLSRQLKSLVKLSLPRFKIETEVSNIIELLGDMVESKFTLGKRVQFHGFSDEPIAISLMTQLASIEVKERHEALNDVDDIDDDYNVYADEEEDEEEYVEFNANHPFGYMLVHKETNIVLFAGVYSDPSKRD